MATSCFWVSGVQLTFFRQHMPYGKLSVPWSVTGLVESSSSKHRLTQTSSHIYFPGHSDGSRWTPHLGQNTRNESQNFYGTYWEGRILLPLWLEPESVYCGIATAVWPPWGKFSSENESQGWTHLWERTVSSLWWYFWTVGPVIPEARPIPIHASHMSQDFFFLVKPVFLLLSCYWCFS